MMPEMMIDTHAHLYVADFEPDIRQVVTHAREAGIGKIFLPPTDIESVHQTLKLTAQYPGFFYPMIGLHPTDVGASFKHELEEMETLLEENNRRFIAIGEVGLDYYWDETFKEEQKEALHRQIGWALHYNLPLMLHVRSAHKDLMQILQSYRREPLRGVFHSFCGTREEAEEMLSFSGFALGINGMVTFKKSPLPDVLPNVPKERLVLETDAPYLTPVPHRGKRNESSYIPYIVRKLAEIYQCSEEEISRCTTACAQEIFDRAR